MNLLNKLESLEEKPVIKPQIETILNKLINVTRTSQWDLLQLNENDADQIYLELENIKLKYQKQIKLKERVEKVKHENISIILPNEDFIWVYYLILKEVFFT